MRIEVVHSAIPPTAPEKVLRLTLKSIPDGSAVLALCDEHGHIPGGGNLLWFNKIKEKIHVTRARGIHKEYVEGILDLDSDLSLIIE